MNTLPVMSFSQWMRENDDLIQVVREELARECPRCDGEGNECPTCGCSCGTYECVECDGAGEFLSPDVVPDHLVRDALRERYDEQVKIDQAKLKAWQSLVA